MREDGPRDATKILAEMGMPDGYLNEEWTSLPKTNVPVTLGLVMKQSLFPEEYEEFEKMDTDNALEKASSMKTLHLEWLGIAEIENLDAFEKVEVLYLQFNRISRLEGLESMLNLQFIALQNNMITVIENLKHLRALEFLDLSRNMIEDFDEEELPVTINELRMRMNPCAKRPNYKIRLVAHLPELDKLDDVDLSGTGGQSTDASGANMFTSNQVQLAAGETGLSAYWRRDEMRNGLASDIANEIQAFSVEALTDSDGFSHRLDGALRRSRERREFSQASTTLTEEQFDKMQRFKAKIKQQQASDIMKGLQAGTVIDIDNKQAMAGSSA